MLALLWRVLAITEVNMPSVWKSIPKVSNFFPIGVFSYLEYCIRLPQSQNDCIEIWVHLDPILLHEGLAWRCGIQLGPFCVILPVRFPPPIHFYLSDMWRELYLPSPEEQFLSTQCCCHSVLWHTDSQFSALSSPSNTTSSLFFILPWESVSWPFFRLSLCVFLVRSLSFLELFLTLPLSDFGNY